MFDYWADPVVHLTLLLKELHEVPNYELKYGPTLASLVVLFSFFWQIFFSKRKNQKKKSREPGGGAAESTGQWRPIINYEISQLAGMLKYLGTSLIISLTHTCGQSYKHFTLVNYDTRVVPDWKIPHIMTLES